MNTFFPLLRLRRKMTGMILSLGICWVLLAAVPAGLAQDQPTMVDVLVVYTPAVKNHYHGEDGVTAHMLATVAATNQAFVNSGIPLILNLVGLREVEYVESNSYVDDFIMLRNPSDGVMDEVHIWRDELKADLVCLIRRGPADGIAGIAGLLTQQDGSPNHAAFSVVSDVGALSDMVFAHEIGHNFGAGHARGEPQFGGMFSHSNAYTFRGNSFNNQYKTIMAYFSGRRIPYFSNPDLNFDGVPLGVPRDRPDSADNAYTLRYNTAIISQYRLADSQAAGTVEVEGSLSFGDVTVGQSSVRTVTLRNVGNHPVRVYGWVLPDGLEAQWSGSIPAGEARSVSFTFRPRDVKTYAGSFVILSNQRTQPTTVTYIGRGLGTGVSPSQILGGPAQWVWRTGGDVPWVEDPAVTHEGQPSLRSGTLEDGQTSWLEVTVEGPGVLEYYWRGTAHSLFKEGSLEVSFGNPGNEDDASLTARHSHWNYNNVNIAAGTRTIRWEYRSRTTIEGLSDYFWISNLRWTPGEAYPQVGSIIVPSWVAHNEWIELRLDWANPGFGYDGLLFQWQRTVGKPWDDPEWEDIPGANDFIYRFQFTIFDVKYHYRIVVSNGPFSKATDARSISIGSYPNYSFDHEAFKYVNEGSLWLDQDSPPEAYEQLYGQRAREFFLNFDFQLVQYLWANPDVLESLGGHTRYYLGGIHWREYGKAAGRRGHLFDQFDPQGYLVRNPEAMHYVQAYPAAERNLRAFVHYWNVGLRYGWLFDDEFSPSEYFVLNPGLQEALANEYSLYTNIRGPTSNHTAFLHWATLGKSEGRLGQIPPAFNYLGYVLRNPDLSFASDAWSTQLEMHASAWRHYLNYGAAEGRMFDDEFRANEYLFLNPDVQAVFGEDYRAALLHWERFGRAEGRWGRIPAGFDAADYLRRYQDVEAAFSYLPFTGRLVGAWYHFWAFGLAEGRRYHEEFEAPEYLLLNGDVLDFFGWDYQGALMHWLRYGKAEGRLGRIPMGFDHESYLANNPDLAAAFADLTFWDLRVAAWLHLWRYGLQEGRKLDDAFRIQDYLASTPLALQVFGNNLQAALLFWLESGRFGILPEIPPENESEPELVPMVAVPGGSIPWGDGLVGVTVAIEPFLMAQTEITWGQWKLVRDWAVVNGFYDLVNSGEGCGDDFPVHTVSWYQVAKWCNAKSLMQGLEPVYKIGSSPYIAGFSLPTQDPDANGYRLPTRWEWEFAAQGGPFNQGYLVSGSNTPLEAGWFVENSQNSPCGYESGYGSNRVAQKLPNELGLYDMAGNVEEWTTTRTPHGSGYTHTAVFYTMGGSFVRSAIVLEGGSGGGWSTWNYPLSGSQWAGLFYPTLGFRVVRAHGP